MSWGLIPMRAMERCPGMKLFQYLPSNDISTKPVEVWCEWTYPIMLVLLLSSTRLGTQRGPKARDAETLTYSIPITEGAEFMIGVPWCNHNTKATRNLQCPPLEPKTDFWNGLSAANWMGAAANPHKLPVGAGNGQLWAAQLKLNPSRSSALHRR